jgi:hypothetical protein
VTPKQFRTLFMVLHNMDLDTLVDGGVILDRTGTNWTRFNSDLTSFVLKLPDDRLAKLATLVSEQMP